VILIQVFFYFRQLDNKQVCSRFWSYIATGNFLSNRNEDGAEKFLTVSAFGAMWFIRVAYYFIVRIKVEALKRTTSTPKAYSLMIVNLPKTCTRKEIADLFSNEKILGRKIKIEKINMAYFIGEFVELIRDHAVYKKKLIKEEKKNYPSQAKIIYFKNKVLMSKQTIDLIYRKYKDENNSQMFTGVCFITFSTIADAELVYQKWRMNSLTYLINEGLRLRLIDRDKLIQNKLVNVVKPPEPADILWENLGYSFSKKVITFVLVIVVIAFTVFVCFIIILSLKYLSISVVSPGVSQVWLKFGFNTLISILIVVTNKLLCLFIQQLTSADKPSSLSTYTINLAGRLFIVILLIDLGPIC